MLEVKVDHFLQQFVGVTLGETAENGFETRFRLGTSRFKIKHIVKADIENLRARTGPGIAQEGDLCLVFQQWPIDAHELANANGIASHDEENAVGQTAIVDISRVVVGDTKDLQGLAQGLDTGHFSRRSTIAEM